MVHSATETIADGCWGNNPLISGRGADVDILFENTTAHHYYQQLFISITKTQHKIYTKHLIIKKQYQFSNIIIKLAQPNFSDNLQLLNIYI